MTIAVDMGRKATKTNKQTNKSSSVVNGPPGNGPAPHEYGPGSLKNAIQVNAIMSVVIINIIIQFFINFYESQCNRYQFTLIICHGV